VTTAVAPTSVRSWPRAIGLAALTIWGPCLAPFVAGPLRECDHCVGTYAACLPIVPGVILPVLCNFQSAWFFVAAALVTLALLGVLSLALRELPRPWSLGVQAVVAVAIGAEACGFASLLRM
jgi:hypothetical protein